MDQEFFNWVLGILMSLLGWLGKTLWDAVQSLKKDINNLEVSIPSEYVKKVELDRRLDKLEALLYKIDDKLDTKVDK